MTGLLLDIMVNGRFHCQMRYPHRPWVKIVDGEGVPTYDIRDLERYVFEKRP